MNLKITNEELKESVFRHIDSKLKKIDEMIKGTKSFTKFDSDNDIFLGYLGEKIFEKYLINKGFSKILDNNNKCDFIRIDEKEDDKNFEKYFTCVENKKYGKYDFLLKLFFNENEKTLPLFKIDVKTQYAKTVNYSPNWQITVNNNTITQIKDNDINNENIDMFVFIYCNKGFNDVFKKDIIEKIRTNNMKKEELKEKKEFLITLKEKYNDFIDLKSETIDFSIAGCINSKDIKNISTKFEKDEIFRIDINSKEKKIIINETKSAMNAINVCQLSNIDKIIPTRKIDWEKDKIINYKEKFKKQDKFVKIINNKGEIELIPYNSFYLKSQYKNFEEFISFINSNF